MSTPIDYHGMKEKIREIIQTDPRTQHAHVFIEAEIAIAAELTPWVGIYTTGRSAPEERQRISSGRDTVYDVEMLIVVAHHDMNGLDKAAEQRDEFMRQLELVLMDNRELGGLGSGLVLKGGPMMSGEVEDQAGFWTEAHLEITVFATASLD